MVNGKENERYVYVWHEYDRIAHRKTTSNKV